MPEPIECPVCRARLDRGPNCRRCRADLTLLFELERQRQVLLDHARAAEQTGDWETALAWRRKAGQLRRSPAEANRERALLLLLGRFSEAWDCFQTNEKLSDRLPQRDGA